ncbi:MAG: CPBP family glutamic-type intramembrane protease [Bacteroidales bacterium]|jgi:membrane protease YdiL (CAAX protease family)|nr:CPBP family glutamic-type intramembrane protease [Bacteroidales bacterium]MDD4673182.1 CPBP family glutamic-type intramembrane protease [Bacteroidales bacterium]
MKANKTVIYGLLLTLIIFVVASLLGQKIGLGVDFIPYTFVTHTAMLILSVLAIAAFQKSVNYKFSIPKFKNIFRPVLFGVLAQIIVNIPFSIITMALNGEIESHPAFDVMSPIQVFVFVFIYASIAEELLFRGFLQNILKPLSAKGITIFKRFFSVPVIISAVAFGLAHTILFTSGVGVAFVVRVVVFTMVLGLVAGYYQEKYNNNAFAIIVHMAGNALGVVGALLMSLSAQAVG